MYTFAADVSHIVAISTAGVSSPPAGIADVSNPATAHKTPVFGAWSYMILCVTVNPSTPLKNVERSKENLPTLIDRAIP